MSQVTDLLAEIDVQIRVKMGADPLTPAALLGQLARDPAVTVRAAVAMNAAASVQSDRQLAADEDERVRLLLARKIAAAVSDMPESEQARLRAQTMEVLTTLVQDEALRVRTAIAEVVAGLPGLPHDLVLRLANDSAIPVSEPVIRLSPLLSPTDLLALVAAPPNQAATGAIARRADLPEPVSDAIAATADTDAIRALLANRSAAIRESTLDALIARSAAQPDWHEPLVTRPTLPAPAARALSEIVSAHLLDVMRARTDLDPALAAELKQRVAGRLAGAALATDGDAALMDAARALDAAGALGEPALLGALRAGEARRAAALLAVAAGVGLEVVDRAAMLRSAKGFVSLVWKAGFGMRVAVTVQTALGQIGPAALLPGLNGAFPLTPEEMRWQLEFLGRTGR